ncbi:uncharacterized protein Z518_00475 [Rhinocladiella mackenziei CBS 650.93]|uniref:Retrotransposon gag domain-containing protein n=1 Tax=Rhinocladiella mackenziei CBS 650.93 TaxID=1442369 RepID=A0A0D2J128_9EURO|nr:uncharacterized protein Z518_00475 [Rhinocladiella mackenziei CBS 650.93]KIX09396.1 hypothetical protein Z518_00475 [Rhinocladiella mackenziei CBS 650.93]
MLKILPHIVQHLETSNVTNLDDETKEVFRSLVAFEKTKQVFGIADEERTAVRLIHDIKQKGSKAQYYTLFKQFSAKFDGNDEMYTVAYYNDLNDRVKDKMDMIPKTYQKLVDESIKINNRPWNDSKRGKVEQGSCRTKVSLND